MDILQILKARRVIAILRGVPEERIEDTARALYDGGVTCIEVTFDQSSADGETTAARSIERLSRGGLILPGAGTVMTARQVETAYRAGARYIISPNVDAEVIARTRELGLVSIPGAFTPTEAAYAYQCGAQIVKLFPASVLGTAYIKALRGPYPHIPLAAVGGISSANARAFLDAGCVCVSAGGALADMRVIRAGEWAALTDAARTLVESINA